MHATSSPIVRPIALLIAAGLASSPLAAYGQASYFEKFDSIGDVNAGQHGPSGLIAKGWTFKNQSSPKGPGSWYGTVFVAKEGPGSMAIDTGVGGWTNASSKASSWAILPAVPGQIAGDPISFWITDPYMVAGVYAVLEVRYSPTGGTNTGSGANDVGDFTQVLLTIPNVDSRPWTKFNTAAPGAGRLAIRFVQPPSPNWQFQGGFFIDSLIVGTLPPGPFPIPQAGQTVHWTPAMSPVVIDYDTEIPAGGTVIIDPDVQVQVKPGVRFDLKGDLEALAGVKFTVPTNSTFNVYGSASFTGTASKPVQLLGGVAWFGGDTGYQVRPDGIMMIEHAQLDALVKTTVEGYVRGGGTIIADHVTATMTGSGFFGDRGTVAVRDSQLTNGGIRISDGYLLIDNTVLTNAVVFSERYKAGQPIYFNNMTATSVASDSPFQLAGYDHFFGPNNTITGNLYPVHLNGGGLAPGSVLPTTGNTNNFIHGGIGTALGRTTFSKTTLPYVIFQDDSFPDVGGRLKIEPGVTVKMKPDAYLWATFGSNVVVEGLPGQPITFEPFAAGGTWDTLNYGVNSNRPKVEHAIFRGMDLGLIADETFVSAESCLFENNTKGMLSNNFGGVEVRKSTFRNNNRGVIVGGNAGYADLNGFTNANAFEGNTLAVEVLDNGTYNGEYNWWNSNTGPKFIGNPNGQGDPVSASVDVSPWRFSPPSTDTPPVVRLQEAPWVQEIGDKLILHWTASDNTQIVSQRIEFVQHDGLPLEIIADNIPADARSWEVTIPPLAPTNLISRSAFRVTATDSLNQEGWDETMLRVLLTGYKAGLPAKAIYNDPLRPGENVPACISKPDGTPVTGGGMWLLVDDLNLVISLGDTGATSHCLGSGMTVPAVSTDMARLALRTSGGSSGFEDWYFTPYFSIRPDAVIGDEAPAVEMLTPANGQSFKGGSTVPISWLASDDEALRSFEIQASYTGGKTWSTVVSDLPATATSYSWKLPPSSGIPDVRVRVVARDLRFQVSSSGADHALAILPGVGGECYADCDTDGTLTIDDFICFQTLFALGEPMADCDGDSVLTIDDFICFQTTFAVGC